MSYDWNRYGNPRLARLNRILLWVGRAVGVLSSTFFFYDALASDWVLIFPCLIIVTGVLVHTWVFNNVYFKRW